MTLMRGYGENLNLADWLNTRIFPFEDKLSSESVYWGTLLGMAESIRFGIVSTSDMYYYCEDMIKATVDAGCKTNISRAAVAFGDEDIHTDCRFLESKKLFEDFNDAYNGKIKVDIALHGEYTSTEKYATQVAE